MRNIIFISLIIALLFNSSYSQGNWQSVNSGVNAYLRDISFISNNVGWVVGHGGTILKTTDSGITWIQQTSNTTKDLYCVDFISDQYGWAGGANGAFLSTSNGGETWVYNQFGTNNFYSLSFVQNNGLALTGILTPYKFSNIIKTTNAGEDWNSVFDAFDVTLLDIYLEGEYAAWAVGTNSNIFRSTSFGENWQFVPAPSLQWLYDVYFIDKYTGWAVGGNVESEFIIKTGDSGLNWNILKESYEYKWLTGVYFLNANIGWAVGYNGVILSTSDGGNTWTRQNSGTSNYLRKVTFTSISSGVAIGENGTIVKYSDNTSNINILKPNGGEIITAGSSYNIEWNSQEISDVKIEFSEDNGTHWITVIDSMISTGIYQWEVPSILSSQCRIKITDLFNSQNFDISDNMFTIQSSKSITLIHPNGGEILEGNSQYEINWSSNDVINIKIEYSLNNGASWNTVIETYPSTGVYNWTVPNIATIQALIRISDVAMPSISDICNGTFRINHVTDIENENRSLEEYQLLQNFPNPFNPTTKIYYQLPYTTFVKLKVFDLLGNEIAMLVDEEQYQGKYQVEFEAKDLPSGIYFYSLQTKDFIQTKKLTLIK